jgi:hypothetical protein
MNDNGVIMAIINNVKNEPVIIMKTILWTWKRTMKRITAITNNESMKNNGNNNNMYIEK